MTSPHRVRLLALATLSTALAFAATACPLGSAPPAVKVKPADRIEAAGHGMLFDAAGREIKLDAAVASEMQASILEVLRASQVKLAAERATTVAELERFLLEAQPSEDERVVARDAILRATLQDAPVALRDRYEWRRRVILGRYVTARPELSAALRDRLRELVDDLVFDPPLLPATEYMATCRERGVPIPPDWAEEGTEWQLQGTLTENLLRPMEHAAVWTYTDPLVRGACIALPRGEGGVGSVAGIICQGATGHACFWDNMPRGGPDSPVGWRGLRLRITDLQDGSNLGDNCTRCHRGSNVFNISPDDPTWRKVLIDLPRDSNFTTQLESSPDRHRDLPRFVPISATPVRPGWDNARPSFEGCNECHESPSGAFTRPALMPPACAASATDATGCYHRP